MLSPRAQELIGDNAIKFIKEIDEAVATIVFSEWSVPEDDIACSAVFLAYARNEADVQIELRYTTGIDLYHPGETFDPPVKMQLELNDSVTNAVAPILAEYQIFCSVWCKPHANSKFTIGGYSD